MKDLVWLRPDGGEMTEAEWRTATLRALGFRLCGEAMDDVNERGERITDETLLILLNADDRAARFALPDAHPGVRWEVLVDTAAGGEPSEPVRHEVGNALALPPRSLQLLRAVGHRP